ncbi:MAG: hypothetical protein E6G47_07790 [Actinobacteria bacterium]|nr:MAG: hypothetical protein E6G47_07790 [Actinomycetota bacterium]
MSDDGTNPEASREAAATVLSELAEAGYPVHALADLRHSRTQYRSAVPVLMKWLPRVKDRGVKEDIVRALSVPWARQSETARALLDEFREVDPEADPDGTGLRWVLGNALEVVWDDSFFDELVQIARDRRFGRARQMVVLGIGKSRDPRAASVLIGLLDDEDVSGHVVKALGKLRAPESRPALESKLDDPRAWVRREAQRALSKLT